MGLSFCLLSGDSGTAQYSPLWFSTLAAQDGAVLIWKPPPTYNFDSEPLFPTVLMVCASENYQFVHGSVTVDFDLNNNVVRLINVQLPAPGFHC